MNLFDRSHGHAAIFTTNVSRHCDRARSHTTFITRLSRWALAFAAIGALAACDGDGESLTGSGAPLSTASVATAAKPAINLQLSPSSLSMGQSTLLTWSVSNAQSCTASGGWSGSKPTSGTLAMAPTSSTSFTLTCTGSGGAAALSRQIVVTDPAPIVTLVASPTTIGSLGSSTLTWSTQHVDQCTATGGWHGVLATSGTWSTGALSNTTEYELTCKGAGGSATQSATVTVSAKAPAVTIQASPSSLSPGGSSTLTWSSENATSCTASGAWSGAKAVSGTQSTGAVTANSVYTLTCSGSGHSASQSATVSVTSAAPTVSLSASPSTVASAGSSMLTWSAKNATACTASNGWSGGKGADGSQSTGALTKSTTYTLVCTGPGGTASQSTTVSVKSALPTVSLSVGPSAISSGASATLTWSSTNATACTASGAWSGTKALSGSQSTGALTAGATYTLSCTGTGGSAQQSATVSVKAAAPTVSLSVSPSSITRGNSASVVWSSSHATSCSASGAWSGTKAISGSQSTGALTANATYSLTCTGAGGNAVQSATVTVTPTPTAAVRLSASPSTIASGAASTLTWSSTNATSCTASGAWSGSKATSGSQSTGALTANATYSLTCTGTGGGATQATTVSVTPPAPTVALAASPSTITSGNSAALTWASSNATSCMASGAWSGAKSMSGSQSTGALKANSTYSLTCTGAGGSATQATTISVTSAAPAPTVSLAANPSSVVSGASSTLSWSTTNATACTASGGWSGSQATSGSHSTGALKANATYTLTCTGAGGSAAQSATVTVSSPAPTVSLSASPSSIASGSSSTLSWSSTNASSCTASGQWSGSKSMSGSQSMGALTKSATYTLACTGTGGSATQSATVTVTSPAPTVTLSASPSTVASGATSTLTWSSTNATSCAASGGWSGALATSGSQKTAALTAATKYTLTCTGAGGTAAQSATVSVTAPATPTVSISASPTSVTSGGSSMLTWSSTNATACTASGGWSGALATSGSKSTGTVSATTTYMLSCTGVGGSASQSATVSMTSSGTGSGTIPKVTALPADLPGPNTSAYDALKVESQAAGYSFSDPATGVKTWKLTDASHPGGGTAFGPVYSEGPVQISLAWGPNKDQYTIMFMNADSSVGYLVDFGLSSSATPGPYNYRAAPNSINGYATVGAASFSRLAPAAHPQLIYVLTTGGYIRLFDADVSVMAYVDSKAASYGYSSSWPSTGWKWTTSLNQWLSTTADEVWIIGNNANSGGSEAFALNLQTGATETWSKSQDDIYVGYGHYVTGDGQTQVWDLDTNTQMSYSEQLTSGNGWAGSEPTYHGSSMRGYWAFYNTDLGNGVIPVATIGNTSSNAAQVSIGSGSTPPYMTEYWGQFHGSGEWWLQTPGADQYFVQSNWSTPSSGWAANAEYAITFWNVGTGQGYRLGHSYTDYVTIGSTSNYWTQPHAHVSHDGKLVIFGSDMRGHGQTNYDRVDLFLMEVPLQPGTPPAFP